MNDMLNVDEYGRVIDPVVHDGHLRQILFIDGGDALLVIRTPSKKEVQLELQEVLAYGILALSHGAIISDVFVWKTVATSKLSQDANDNPWRVLCAGQLSPVDTKVLSSKFIRDTPDAFLVQVLCSYGGSLAAVCRGLSVRTVG